MHPNPIFHDADAARNLNFARDRGFGLLVTNAFCERVALLRTFQGFDISGYCAGALCCNRSSMFR